MQECKAQNTRLIDYFQRVDVLQRLFAYVSWNIEDEGIGKYRSVLRNVLYPVAEVLNCSSSHVQISLYLHGSAMQRTMVHCRNLPKQQGPVISTLLGRCTRPYINRHERTEYHGILLREDKCHISDEETSRGNVSVLHCTSSTQTIFRRCSPSFKRNLTSWNASYNKSRLLPLSTCWFESSNWMNMRRVQPY